MLKIRPLTESDIALIVAAFVQIGWNKSQSLFQHYLQEQAQGQRFAWAAFKEENFLGYVTLKLHSDYQPFAKAGIPEISDLNVLPQSRKQGIGSALLKIAESKAREFSAQVGIGVGLTADYGAAQKLYVKRGYVPDGRGITYNCKSVIWDHDYKVDDNLVLWFMRDLRD